jgi:hypothetical protein
MQVRGQAHFEDHVVGFIVSPQREDWQTTIWGFTAHTSWRF